MGNSESKSNDAPAADAPAPAAGEKPKCKACCACPETKKVRDQWYVERNIFSLPLLNVKLTLSASNRLLMFLFHFICSIVEKGEENCTELIEAHKKCMREQGFNI